MTEEEQVYALFVQANPVPNPAVLPLTLEATKPLLQSVEEGKRTMLTEGRTTTEPPRGRQRWLRPLAVAAAVFIVVLAAGFIGSRLGGGDTAVAAADADLAVTFDGTTAIYNGPDVVEVGTADLTMSNLGAEEVQLALWRYTAEETLEAELGRFERGSDYPASGSPSSTGGYLHFRLEAPAGSDASSQVLLAPGWYVFDVLTLTYGVPERLVEVIEVVEE